MKKSLILVLLLATPLLAKDTKSPKSLHILFIGNSYSFYLPETIAKFAEANKRKLTYKEAIKGGWDLEKHAEDPETLALIREGGWDYVVIQGQSQRPSFPERNRVKQFYPPLEKLHAEVKKTGAKTLLYLTWARPKGDRDNIPDDTFDAMQKRLLEGYENAAKKTSARIIPVGLAWQKVSKKKRAGLYSKDGSHPNAKGLYLNACVFFRFLFNSKARVGIRLQGDPVSPKEAKALHKIANSVKYKQPK